LASATSTLDNESIQPPPTCPTSSLLLNNFTLPTTTCMLQSPAHRQLGSQLSSLKTRILCIPLHPAYCLPILSTVQIQFSVLLETSAASLGTSLQPLSLQFNTKTYHSVKDQNVRVSIWHNHREQDDWSELPLQASGDLDDVVSRRTICLCDISLRLSYL
jgi:hypothetical protein